MKTQLQPAERKLRRINLDAQGLLKKNPFGRGKHAVLAAIEHLGYVQIDTISVVARAHHHILRTRVPNYQPVHLDRLQREGLIFEYWYHAAAYLPMRDYRYSLPLMQKMTRREDAWVRSYDDALMADVIRHVTDTGPTRARDFETPDRKGAAGWWNWKPAKRALEQLFMQGDLMITGREGFEKVYDLRERVLPDSVDTRTPDDEEMADYLLDNTLRSHGFATARCMTHGRVHSPLRQLVRNRIDEQLEEGTLVKVTLSTGESMYSRPETLARRAPAASPTVRILSPFDNVVIQRQRSQNVFEFDYQIECYVPEAKRRFGYFCLPILYGDQLVGRADCKAHRQEQLLEIKSLHIEKQLPDTDEDQFIAALHSAFVDFATFNDCPDIQYRTSSPPAWSRRLARI